MIRKKKGFLRPRRLYEKARIAEENALALKYALKSKREIWKTLAKVKYFRKRAMELAKKPREEQQVLFNKLNALGLKVNSIADILDLKLENILERRLPTIVANKNLANTPQHARQMTAHKKVLVDGKVINSPSYLVSVAEENKITVKKGIAKPKKAKEEEKTEDVKELEGEENA